MLLPVWLRFVRPRRRGARIRPWLPVLVDSIAVRCCAGPRIGVDDLLGRQPVPRLPTAWPVLCGNRGVKVLRPAIVTGSCALGGSTLSSRTAGGSTLRSRTAGGSTPGRSTLSSSKPRFSGFATIATPAVWFRHSRLAVSALASRPGRSRRRSGRRSRALTSCGTFVAAGGPAQDRVEGAYRVLDNRGDRIAGA
jgi:hypothetical protein